MAEDRAVTALVSVGAGEVAEVVGSGTIVDVVFVEATAGVAAEELTIAASVEAAGGEYTLGAELRESILELVAGGSTT